jgi:hypothetical protein
MNKHMTQEYQQLREYRKKEIKKISPEEIPQQFIIPFPDTIQKKDDHHSQQNDLCCVFDCIEENKIVCKKIRVRKQYHSDH